MTVIIFIIILAVLVFVHELGHFAIAKISKIRVDEFGLGFPPKLFKWKPKKSETSYSLNLIPFGGFVKIFGENPDEESISGPDSKRSFVNKNRAVQIAVLAAGVVFNIIFAWLLISAGSMTGLPTSLTDENKKYVENAALTITAVSPNSPAESAGFKAGDRILFVEGNHEALQGDHLTAEAVQDFITRHGGVQLSILYKRGSENLIGKVTPEEGVVEGRPAIGISMDVLGTMKLPFFKALWESAKLSGFLLKEISIGLFQFIAHAFKGDAHFSQISGPVGIAHMVDDARTLGFVYLVSFTAFISLNLAVLNLIPFPALDGGRILFVLLETIIRKRIKPSFLNGLNAVGFALLIILMIAVTYKDIVKIIQ